MDTSGCNATAGGGVAFLIDSNFEYEILEDLAIFDKHVFESIFA